MGVGFMARAANGYECAWVMISRKSSAVSSAMPSDWRGPAQSHFSATFSISRAFSSADTLTAPFNHASAALALLLCQLSKLSSTALSR